MDEHNVPTHMGVSLGHEKGGGADTKGTDLEYTMLSERRWTQAHTVCDYFYTANRQMGSGSVAVRGWGGVGGSDC